MGSRKKKSYNLSEDQQKIADKLNTLAETNQISKLDLFILRNHDFFTDWQKNQNAIYEIWMDSSHVMGITDQIKPFLKDTFNIGICICTKFIREFLKLSKEQGADETVMFNIMFQLSPILKKFDSHDQSVILDFLEKINLEMYKGTNVPLFMGNINDSTHKFQAIFPIGGRVNDCDRDDDCKECNQKNCNKRPLFESNADFIKENQK